MIGLNLDIAWNEKMREFEVRDLADRLESKLDRALDDLEEQYSDRIKERISDVVGDINYEYQGYLREVRALIADTTALHKELTQLVASVKLHIETNEINIDLSDTPT